MSEVYTSPFTVTLSSGYTAGASTISVSGAAPVAVQSGTFRVRLANASNTVLKVTGGASTTTWSVTAEFNDANASLGATVYGCEFSPGALDALLPGPPFPLTILQESQGSSGGSAVTSYTFTFPQALAASGATAFMVVSSDGSQTVNMPSGWTADINQVRATYARFTLLRKTSAGDTSATFTTSAGAAFAVFFFEVSGTHTLDQSAFTARAESTSAVFPTITPTANSLVFGMAATLQNGATPSEPLASVLSPNWKPIFVVANLAGGGRILAGFVSLVGARATATTPPILNMPQMPLFSGGGMVLATFSIL